MGFPQIPEAKFRPTLKETVIDLMESVALEELAISHLVNAEAEKTQAFVGRNFDFPACDSFKDIMAFNQSVNRLMDSIIMKEWLLLRKLESVMQIETKPHHGGDCDCEE